MTFLRELWSKVLYFANYIVLDPANSGLQYKQVLTEREYQDAREAYGYDFRVGMGAESIKELLEAIDLEKDSVELKKELKRCYRPETCQNHQTSGSCRILP